MQKKEEHTPQISKHTIKQYNRGIGGETNGIN
jgi:hypothetical protein